MTSPIEIKKRYENGENISAILRKEYKVDSNTPEIIEIAYDMQTGSYIEALKDQDLNILMALYTKNISNIITTLIKPESIMEAGVGEATTLNGVLSNLDKTINSYGFDLSWSRVAYGKKFLESNDIFNSTLFSGDLFNIPVMDSSIDVVYTSHSIEPNGGREEEIIKELYRVTNRFLILLEPSYELSNQKIKDRMDKHGYCKNIKETALSLNYNVITHELFPYNTNPNNPTAITIIEKNTNQKPSKSPLACPKYRTPVELINGSYYSQEALIAYPIVGGIPCLKIENGIIASKYKEVDDLQL